MKRKIIQNILFLIIFLFFAAYSQRIRVEGNKFLVGDNHIFMLGANTPWHQWNEFGHNFNSSWWDEHFKTLNEYGLNCTRVWISCNGDNSSPGIDEKGKVLPPTEAFWKDVGELFNIAQKYKIYMMIALISFDHTKNGNKNAELWRAMYKNPENRQSFVDNYVIPFVKKFGENPYFWAIDVGNELDWVHENDSVPISDVFDLVARVANGVHANSKVLVTLGTGAGPKYLSPNYGINYYSDAELQKLQSGAYLDFYNDHFYDWMFQWFSSPFVKSPKDWRIDEKPCIIGEYCAKGHGEGFNPAECLEKAYNLGWLGVMPWTSNGVDNNGSINDFGPAFKKWSDSHKSLVFPAEVDNPGPFTLTIIQPTGGKIKVEPEATEYTKGTKVTLVAIPDRGNEILKWTGDASGNKDTIVVTMTRHMTISLQFVAAGEIVLNGKFEEGLSPWELGQYDVASASVNTTNKECEIKITNGGSQIWHVQLIQAGLSLDSAETYIFSFDIMTSEKRSLYVAIGEASGNYTKYFEKTIESDTKNNHFSYEFTQKTNTNNVRVEFNLGLSTGVVKIDNVSLRKKISSKSFLSNNIKQISDLKIEYRSPEKKLILENVLPNTIISGFSTNGRKLFTYRYDGRMEKIISIPLKSKTSQIIFVSGSKEGKLIFSKKIVCF